VVLHKGRVLAHGLVSEVIAQSDGADLREAFSRLTGAADQDQPEMAR
jgi:ABC-2 type transport system ATP-binding protein